MKARPSTVIICTHNRAKLLPRIVGQVRAQEYPAVAFEIVVVAHRCTDDTPQVVEDLAAEPGVSLRCVAEERSGVSFARNRGAQEAVNPYLAYIDDDCTVGADWLEQLVGGFDLDERVAAVSGQVRLQWDEQRPAWFTANLEPWFAVNGHLGNEPRLLRPSEHIVEGNMALERAAWQAAGGFLGMEQFGSRNMAAGEVLYLLQQLNRQGRRTAFVPEALAVHHVGPRSRRWMLQRSYWQGVSDAVLDYLLNPRSISWSADRWGTNGAAFGLFLLLAAWSVLRRRQGEVMYQLARAARRMGLLLGEMHFAGDWPRARAWASEHKQATEQRPGGPPGEATAISSWKTPPNVSRETSPRLALIGCGAIADEYYAPALARHPALLDKLILVDRVPDQARRLAARLKVESYAADYTQVLNQVDGALIAVPTHLHHPIALEFLSRGVPVFCEKPLAECAAKARELVEQASRSGTVLAVNYLQRLIPSFAKVREMLATRALGDVLLIRYCVAEEFRWPTVSGFYFNSPLAARGILRDRGAHALDHICWWLRAKPQLIVSHNDSFGGSEAVAQVLFQHGRCQGDLTLSWLATLPSTFTVVCEEGILAGDVYDYSGLVLKTSSGQPKRLALDSKEKTKIDIASKLLSNFVDVIQRGAEPLVAGSHVLDSIEFADECYAAAAPFAMPWYSALEAPGVL